MATEKKLTLTDFTLGRVRDWAVYVVTSRAIPSMIDGLKPSQRFYLYCSLKEKRGSFEKVSGVAGPASKYGYAHGEASLSETGQRMAAEWANNVRLIEGQGSFGTRLVPKAGAPRYTKTRVHKNFEVLMTDEALHLTHEDPEVVLPQTYFPIIPLVLVNGAQGIATGFRCLILPRSAKDVAAACKEYLTNGEIKKPIPVSFPQFTGKTVFDEVKGQYQSHGIFKRQGQTKLIVEEVPPHFDRIAYVEVLEGLVQADQIASYKDMCGKDGFKFEVRTKKGVSDKWSDANIMKHLKLTSPHTEILNVISADGKLLQFGDARDIVAAFCDHRLELMERRLEQRISALTEEIAWLLMKWEFISDVVEGNIKIMSVKKADLVDRLKTGWFGTEPIAKDKIERLLALPVHSLTQESMIEASKEIERCLEAIKAARMSTPKDEFLNDLKLVSKLTA